MGMAFRGMGVRNGWWYLKAPHVGHTEKGTDMEVAKRIGVLSHFNSLCVLQYLWDQR